MLDMLTILQKMIQCLDNVTGWQSTSIEMTSGFFG
jgi:hypothetical protein